MQERTHITMDIAQLNEIWEQIVLELQNDPQYMLFAVWINQLEPVSFENNCLVMKAKKNMVKEWIERRYMNNVTKTLHSIWKKDIQFHIILDPDAQDGQEAPIIPVPVTVPAPRTDTVKKEEEDTFSDLSFLNPNYTFANFVSGNSTMIAFSTSQAVAEHPGEAYNPLFLYGNSGLGKTHLLHAIAHKILEKNPNAKIVYASSEKFTNELINAIRDNSTEAFRQKYRNIDLLLIDDIQFLTKKERTQEEFFHTFNTLYEAKKQIVITSDRQPREIQTLDDRLKSRFESGMTADIKPPDLETRIAILRKKVALMGGMTVPDNIIIYIASRIDNNVRTMEGALIRLKGYIKTMKKEEILESGDEITVKIADDALKEIFLDNVKPPITVDLIQKITTDYFKISMNDLLGKKRTKNVVVPRQIAMYLCRELTEESFPHIGELFGGRDHTTIIHAFTKISNERMKSRQIDNVIKELITLIENN